MRNGEGIVAVGGKRGEIGYDEKSSSNSPGLSLQDSLAGWVCTSLNKYPALRFSRQELGVRGVRGVIVGVSGEKRGETNGPNGKRTFVDIGVYGEGDSTEMDGELK